ncbi:MAG: Rpn family recombination-promoting nuclease/putative transposase [Treponemataceae bacterium]|nr:Rpn family recombination-promoting nuclease/putative transposase [Spirochaetales bacterium]MDY6030208.1 Rpn family recombination-promoting nuclease/putative transposase [Treponemataceae bacterium]
MKKENEEREYTFRPFDELTFTDGFMFYLAMQDEEICKGVIERLLGIKIKKIEYLNTEETMKVDYESKSIRLDVYTEADNKVYDVEVQTYKEDDIGKRLRYYQSVIDIDNLKHGQPYSKLKESIIIFIATRDLLKKGLSRYTFSNICHEDTNIELNDKTLKVIYNLKGDFNNLKLDEKELLEYMANGKSNNKFTDKIDGIVAELKKQEKWRREYMTWEMTMLQVQETARNEGISQGAHDKAVESAQKMLAAGLPIEQICKFVDLPADEVKALQN